ncbi:hypothetical protein H9P43_006725 [Blastocladiella emersonii ATCC 22665]|nr:hypothetical protein H9P43_006725 [Blastocladiella emersonii ATCC 22665]
MISSDHDLSLDEWREHLAGTMPVPSSWYSKSDEDKAKWLQKRDCKANRYTHVDNEAARAERVKIRIYKALNAKRRDQGANSTATGGRIMAERLAGQKIKATIDGCEYTFPNAKELLDVWVPYILAFDYKVTPESYANDFGCKRGDSLFYLKHQDSVTGYEVKDLQEHVQDTLKAWEEHQATGKSATDSDRGSSEEERDELAEEISRALDVIDEDAVPDHLLPVPVRPVMPEQYPVEAGDYVGQDIDEYGAMIPGQYLIQNDNDGGNDPPPRLDDGTRDLVVMPPSYGPDVAQRQGVYNEGHVHPAMDEARMIKGSKDLQVYNPERALTTTDDMEVDVVQNFQQFNQFVYNSYTQQNTQNVNMRQFITQYENNYYEQNVDMRQQILVQYNNDPNVMAALELIALQFAGSQVMQYQAYQALIEQSAAAQGLAMDAFANLASGIVDTLRAKRNNFARQIDAGNRALVSEIATGMSSALSNQQVLMNQLASGVQGAIQGQTQSNEAMTKTLQDLGSKLDTIPAPQVIVQPANTSGLEAMIRELAAQNNSGGSSKKTDMLLEQILKQLGYKKPTDAKLFTDKRAAGSGLTAPKIQRHQKIPERPVKQVRETPRRSGIVLDLGWD